EELEKNLPAKMKQFLAKNDISFYVINATDIAENIGLGNRTNMIMQSAFFKLSNVIPLDDAVKYMKDAIDHTYGKKGEKILEMNYKAVDEGIAALKKITVPAAWATSTTDPVLVCGLPEEIPAFIRDVCMPINAQKGDDLPVSAFVGREDGHFPSGTSAYEKRGVAVNVPEWDGVKCIQCNQ
ncbi:MAG TPA: pyruvate:ferredoxin (flavodoxin) oxidoreductase, partial [Synergistaceae bacterium]|nr:pyruvate:ferredoxin (flavodoxin) oxidoreductase [Synergistaceae bacterium]